ncbi:BLUF domain-containing protein [Hymenobacter busanensis]|uniref:BLUF domain-containing protein n=2 Tax=Hymenobacter busanensis TaxID=2607656 RepID=A0AA88FJP0_9BACT|nr:BLUF domain-containing protein [Hymenobacter busanensis]
MHHIIYVSTATEDFTPAQLQALLHHNRQRNARYHVTGILLYHEGRIMQLLEGDEAPVRYLYQQIAQDARHTGVVKLADEAIASRSFAQWHMAYWEVEAQDFAYAAGYIPLQEWAPPPGRFGPEDALRLEVLRAFVLPEAG